MKDPFRKILDKRFGMFVHYGIYSALAGFYRGKRIEGLGEWIQKNGRIPISEYSKIGREQFCPSENFARDLVLAAKKAGIRYIILTSKHHDGFCLFKTAVSDYNTYDYFGRDLCRELADECRKEGLDIGFYYSHTLDWYEKNAAGNFYAGTGTRANNRNSWDYPDDNIDFEKYLREKCIPQVKELLTNYGPLNIIWFDFPHDITKEQSAELRKIVKELQPSCQINSRIAHGLCDYYSLGDNVLPTAPNGIKSECLVTLNHTWGYRSDDHDWKSPESMINILSRCLTSDSTLLLNVGPRADGSLTTETKNILNAMGEWTARNSEAVYGDITGNPFSSEFPWGYVSVNDKNLYLYLKDPRALNLELAGIDGKITSVSLLGCDGRVSYSYKDGRLNVACLKTELKNPVYRVKFESTPTYSRDIIQNSDVISLGILWASKIKGSDTASAPERLIYEFDEFDEKYRKHGLAINRSNYAHMWTSSDESLVWDAYINEPGTYSAELIHVPYNSYLKEEYSKPCELKDKFIISADGQANTVDIPEKSRYCISLTGGENVRIVHSAGSFKFDRPGKYRIILSRAENGESLAVTDLCFAKLS